MLAVSVVMATYNHGRCLERAIRSLLEQTVERSTFEIIVVDDGSTDNTREVLRRYASDLMVLDRPHAGLVDACNAGIAVAQGAYVLRVDADDTVEPGLLARERAALETTGDAVCVYSDRYEVSESELRHVHVREDNLYDLIACGVLMRRDALKAAGGFRRVFWEEYDLFLRLKRYGRFVHIPEPLYRYLRHPLAMTSDARRRSIGWCELIDLWGLDVLRTHGVHAEMELAGGHVAGRMGGTV